MLKWIVAKYSDGFSKRIVKHMNHHTEFLRRCLDILIMSRDYEMLKAGGYSLLQAGNNEDILKLKIGGYYETITKRITVSN